MVMLIGDGVGPPKLVSHLGLDLHCLGRVPIGPTSTEGLRYGIAHVRIFREITGADVPKRDVGPQAKPIAAKLEDKPKVVAGCFVEATL